MSNQSLSERFARFATRWTGSSGAFALALLAVLVWAATGPFYHYSETWQLVINTGTTIVTFLMVFVIQRSQNKDSLALHLKLNEIVAALQGASNRLIAAEDLCENELDTLRRHYGRLVELAECEASVTESHSVEEARGRHERKHASGLPPERSIRRDPALAPPTADAAPANGFSPDVPRAERRA
ncbi:low affinity iron permease family protein [Candidatus Binatia bacterium]|nr:low affinity iron permease family protein [Candidatus Binatia bacterium]